MQISFYYIQTEKGAGLIDFGTPSISGTIPTTLGTFYADDDTEDVAEQINDDGYEVENLLTSYWWYEESVPAYYQGESHTLLGTHEITSYNTLMQALHYYLQHYKVKANHPELFI